MTQSQYRGKWQRVQNPQRVEREAQISHTCEMILRSGHPFELAMTSSATAQAGNTGQ